jgi:hypothetical protein
MKSQRFGKIKIAATNRTKPKLCSTFDFAPTAPRQRQNFIKLDSKKTE